MDVHPDTSVKAVFNFSSSIVGEIRFVNKTKLVFLRDFSKPQLGSFYFGDIVEGEETQPVGGFVSLNSSEIDVLVEKWSTVSECFKNGEQLDIKLLGENIHFVYSESDVEPHYLENKKPTIPTYRCIELCVFTEKDQPTKLTFSRICTRQGYNQLHILNSYTAAHVEFVGDVMFDCLGKFVEFIKTIPRQLISRSNLYSLS